MVIKNIGNIGRERTPVVDAMCKEWEIEPVNIFTDENDEEKCCVNGNDGNILPEAIRGAG